MLYAVRRDQTVLDLKCWQYNAGLIFNAVHFSLFIAGSFQHKRIISVRLCVVMTCVWNFNFRSCRSCIKLISKTVNLLIVQTTSLENKRQTLSTLNIFRCNLCLVKHIYDRLCGLVVSVEDYKHRGHACGTHRRGEESVLGFGGKARRKETTGKTKA
jgi:hypothetical protein